MTFSIATAAIVFALIFPVELPDKTFVATLVLATRYRPLLVWVGVTAAFLVQTVVAVTLGGLLARLPHAPVQIVAALMFALGGVILLRGARNADREEREAEEEFEAKAAAPATGLRAVSTSFLVLFLAEWGDLSQLLTASLAARYHDPVSVGVGAFVALATISALGAALGRTLLRYLKLATIRRIGGSVCLLLAVITLVELARG
ncbi:MAG TPA: TMEM165/GDT1 family protein [Tetrasphaera sp.]|uniref:TMEM165/GDT1 family protein n=1 Tax=Nostocoides sp. TaxID=1917966 RepID=UPI002B7825F7|nr:TMEM165/GDT1 family protein [Tetrasphaera sp.]HNQ07779.1 TMEM165/GDT1 family protein [Tetrasphaera sp.]